MIRSFRDRKTEAFFTGKDVREFRSIRKALERKLTYVDNAAVLGDLRALPGNRLEKLSGDRDGQYSIRVNDQWRVCFVWKDDGPHDVEVVDYH
ncbi:MAG TPA: type II toxin-antitoxin system RelE/ParE family toxin [Stellaceae bacterium]|nr:type II toxin-antitoxin system RelE/ParE family toxin [Stellaceae bacterium]